MRYSSKSDEVNYPARHLSIDTAEDINPARLPAGSQQMVESTDGGRQEFWYGTPEASQPQEQNSPLLPQGFPKPSMRQSKDTNYIINSKYEAQEAMAYAMFQKRMKNAGAMFNPKTGQIDYSQADEALVMYANSAFQNDVADLQQWKRTLDNKLQLIQDDESFTQDEKDLLRDKLMARTKDAIYIPEMTSTQINKQPRQTFNESYIQKNLGELMTSENILDYNDAISGPEGVIARFGPTWEQIVPEAKDIIQSRFANQTSPAKGVKPTPGGTASQPKTQEEYDALPSGALYIEPSTGETRRKK